MLMYRVLNTLSEYKYFYISKTILHTLLLLVFKSSKAFIVFRNCATFKMRKFESLFYKIDTFLQKTTTCTGLQAQEIFSVNIEYIYFSNFGRGFCSSFSMSFPKTPASWDKKNWNNFCCIVLIFAWAEKVCLRFLKPYFKLKILIFLSFVVSSLVDMFN